MLMDIGTLIDLSAWVEGMEIENNLTIILIKTAQIITIAVPPALPTCMQIGVSIALAR